jgi:hypothetical protein
MKVLNAVRSARWRAAALGLVAAAGIAGTASAAITALTMNDTAPLSPGMLHATLSGTIACDPGSSSYVSGQIVQSKGTTGYGYGTVTCDGTPQAYAIDVSAGGGFPGTGGGAFKAGKANAQVSTSSCDPITWLCTSRYVDAQIRLTK